MAQALGPNATALHAIDRGGNAESRKSLPKPMSDHQHHHGSRCADDVAMDRRLLATIVLNAVIAIAEFAAGIVGGSLAMLSDAAHNLGDVAAIVLALVARRLGLTVRRSLLWCLDIRIAPCK